MDLEDQDPVLYSTIAQRVTCAVIVIIPVPASITIVNPCHLFTNLMIIETREIQYHNLTSYLNID